MKKEETLIILENYATDATGALADAKSEEEAKAIQRYIEALDVAIGLLKDDLNRNIGPISDYENMLISAVRYAIGRRTYIVSLTVNYIIGELPKLSHKCRYVMKEDIEKAEYLGDKCDEEDWAKLLRKLDESLREE